MLFNLLMNVHSFSGAFPYTFDSLKFSDLLVKGTLQRNLTGSLSTLPNASSMPVLSDTAFKYKIMLCAHCLGFTISFVYSFVKMLHLTLAEWTRSKD